MTETSNFFMSPQNEDPESYPMEGFQIIGNDMMLDSNDDEQFDPNMNRESF